ncbi:MAG: hypothetical protein GY856_55440 [bacterium]|nr:hypothetical protein [bacterium]
MADSPARLGLRLADLAETTGMRVLLFVDQLEELFTLVDDDEIRQCFLKALLGSADDRLGPVRTIFCIREDFLGRSFCAW